jgi:acyl-coenzyme A synthetase/AMP-(fatty) acid ligase
MKNKRARQEHLAFALYPTTAQRGGLDFDLLDDTYWWGATDPMWRYALWAAVIYLLAGAEASSVAEAEFLDRVGGVLQLDV